MPLHSRTRSARGIVTLSGCLASLRDRLSGAERSGRRSQTGEIMTTALAPRSQSAAEQIAVAAYDPALTDVRDEQVTCMSEGHEWPRLRLGRKMPKGIHYYLNSDDTYQRVDICTCCGTERVRTTLPRGVYDPNQTYSYIYPEWWVHFHLSDDMPRVRLKTEHSVRSQDMLITAAG